jgi:hypothetical protein
MTDITEQQQLKKCIKDSKHFCILPWIHFHAWPDRTVMPCCVADSKQPISEIADDKSILDIMNSEGYKDIRLKMLNDEPVSACQRCYDLESVGVWSLRQSQNTVRGQQSLDLVEATNNDGSIDNFKLKYMDIRFSNLCNFKCRSCGPGCSNLWGEEKLKIVGPDEWINRHGRDPLLTNNKDGTFMEKLKPYLSDVEECYFAGGEILVTPEHYDCLDHWIDTGVSKNVKLNYTTNMSKISHIHNKQVRDLFELWSNFREVEIWASIDAIEQPGEIIRKGFKWDKVRDNLLAIKSQAPFVKVGITPTISVWNIFYYLKMFDWMVLHGFISEDNAPRINFLTAPEYANIKYLPDRIRIKLITEMQKCLMKYTHTTHIKNGINTVIHTLWEGREDKEKMKEFFSENFKLDDIRDEELLNTLPELKEVYEWTLT